MPKCRAKNRKGNRCGRDATPGREVCNLHGGKSLRGAASPQFKNGRYSNYIPGRLLDRYNEAANDPELLNLRAEISLVDARIADLLQRVDSGESGSLWQQLQAIVAELDAARAAGDRGGIAAAVNDLTTVVKQGHSDYVAWDEITKAIDQRRRLVESERKRLVEMQQFVTSEQAMALVTALNASVKKHVSDRAALTAISEDFIRLTSAHAAAEAIASYEG